MANRIPTNVEVSLIEWSDIDGIVTHMQKNVTDPNRTVTKAEMDNAWGFVDTPNGMYVLCDEGVGDDDPVTEENPMVFQFRGHFEDNVDGEIKKRIEMLPSIGMKTGDPEEIREMATGEKVNLADFIRTFGTRLEVNYGIWKDALENASVSVPA